MASSAALRIASGVLLAEEKDAAPMLAEIFPIGWLSACGKLAPAMASRSRSANSAP